MLSSHVKTVVYKKPGVSSLPQDFEGHNEAIVVIPSLLVVCGRRANDAIKPFIFKVNGTPIEVFQVSLEEPKLVLKLLQGLFLRLK